MAPKRKYTEADPESSSSPALDTVSNRNLDADALNTSTNRLHPNQESERSDSEPMDIDSETDSTEPGPSSSGEELPCPPSAKETDDETEDEEEEDCDNAKEVMFNTILNRMNEIFDKSPKSKKPVTLGEKKTPVTSGEKKTVCWAADLTAVKTIPVRGSTSWALGDEGLGEDGDETESESEEE